MVNSQRSRLLPAAISIVLIGTGVVHAQDLIGARNALQKVKEQASELAGAAVAAKPGSNPLQEKLKALPGHSEKLEPAAAAMAWLEVYDHWLKSGASPTQVSPESPVEFATLIAVLPRPAAWRPLSEMIDARPIGGD